LTAAGVRNCGVKVKLWRGPSFLVLVGGVAELMLELADMVSSTSSDFCRG
jgi:hypothetical protein